MRIFATVGTHPQQFDRLLKEIDSLAARRKGKDVFFAQTGNSVFAPKNFLSERFLPPAEIEKVISRCDVVISHGGAGSIIGALEKGKPLVIVPRLKRFGEHTNDHQLDLAIAMQKAGKAVAVVETNGLEAAISRALSLSKKKSAGAAGIVKSLGDFFGKGAFSNG